MATMREKAEAFIYETIEKSQEFGGDLQRGKQVDGLLLRCVARGTSVELVVTAS